MITWHDDIREGFHRFSHGMNWVHISIDLYRTDPVVRDTCIRLMDRMRADTDSAFHHSCFGSIQAIRLFERVFELQRIGVSRVRQLMERSVLA